MTHAILIIDLYIHNVFGIQVIVMYNITIPLIINDNNIVINTPGNDSKESNSISERLIELHDLKEKGILSEEEYANQKTKVLE